MKAFFVTGTDTGIGKTTVTASIVLAARARGMSVACMKPLESGCARDPDGRLIPADAVQLWTASGAWQDLGTVCAYAFEAAAAPGVAARTEGVDVDFGLIAAHWRKVQSQGPDLSMIEGAGGWLVPAGRGHMIADLAVMFALPVLIVARPGLGTINHSLLTIEAVRQRGLEVAAVAFSDATGAVDPAAMRANAAEIEQAGQVRVLGMLRHVLGGADGRAAEADLLLEVLLGEAGR